MQYDFSQYDKYLNLKVNAGLWLVVLYLMRPYVVLMVSLMGHRGGTSAVGIEGVRYMLYPDDFSLVLALLATLPVLLFFYALSKRRPGASALVRNLWGNGIFLLVTAAVLNIVTVFVPILTGATTRIPRLGWVQVVLACLIIAYLYSSRRARDTFADSPVENERHT